jgi:hypothetical protein
MSLLEKAVHAAGGERWSALSHFTTYVTLKGSLVRPLRLSHPLGEIVAEGDLALGSMRIAGFSQARWEWGFHPDFVTIQRDDGSFVGTRCEAAPRPFHHPKDEAELVYLCGLSIWSCITAPMAMLGSGAQFEELGAWSERDENWWRLAVTVPEGVLAYARQAVMYFGDDGLLRRTDFDVECGERFGLVVYSSAYESFSGLTMPTLYRAVRGQAAERPVNPRPVLDVEIFDAVFA